MPASDDYATELRGDVATADAKASAESGGHRNPWGTIATVVGAVVGGIIIAQLQFFGSSIIDQGKLLVRFDERIMTLQNTVKEQGERYERERQEIIRRITELEQRYRERSK